MSTACPQGTWGPESTEFRQSPWYLGAGPERTEPRQSLGHLGA